MTFEINSFIKGSIIFSLTQVLARSSSFLLIPIYIHYLTSSENGVLGIILILFQLFVHIFLFGAHATEVRYYSDLK
jgi:O-antigen/teichoic acid export membrane protein